MAQRNQEHKDFLDNLILPLQFVIPLRIEGTGIYDSDDDEDDDDDDDDDNDDEYDIGDVQA